MAKVPINQLSSGYRSNTALNANLQAVQQGFENTLSRDGTGPNQMEAVLDMNDYRVINVGEPVNAGDALRKGDVQFLLDAEQSIADDVLLAQEALDEANQAQTDAENTLNAVNAAVATTNANAAATAADRVQTGLDRIQTGEDVAEAQQLLTQVQLAALAFGAPLFPDVAAGEAGTSSGDIFLVSTEAGTQVYENQSGTGVLLGWIGKVAFNTVAALLASTGTLGPTGNIVEAQGYRYQVVTSGAHVTTAGSVQLIVLPDPIGYSIEAFGADMSGVTSANSILTTAASAANTAGIALVINPGTLNITASITLECNVNVLPGGKFSFASSGLVLTFNGPFTGTLNTIFTGTLNSTTGPRWGSGTIDAMRPEWFGAEAYPVSGGSPIDSSTAILNMLHAGARGVIGFTYNVEFAQGLYGIGVAIDLPGGGNVDMRGQGLQTQLRAINSGAGFPTYIFKFVSSTTDSRIRGLYFYGGSVSRPCDYAIYSAEMKHTHVTDCLFSQFDIAAIASSEWDNLFFANEFSFCHVGIWLRRSGGNNNDINIDTCRFISCETSIACNGGTAVRIRNGQFQAALVAPFTRTFIYSQGISGFSVTTNYFETQPTGGLTGMAFTVPTTLQLYATIIFNNSPYFLDEVGTVTTTLAQSSSNLGTVGSVTDNLFATPAYWQAGAGGTGYTAGAVTFTAVTGTGTGASGTITVTGSNVLTPTASTPGTGFKVGDIVLIDQGGNTTAHATVANVGANNGIATLHIGSACAIYAGNCRSLIVSGNLFSPSQAAIGLYNDRSICDPRRIVMSQNVLGTLEYQFYGPMGDTVSAALGNFETDNINYLMAVNSGFGPQNYFPASWAFSATPTASTFVRQAGRSEQYPLYRFSLLPGNTTSDTLTGSFPVSTSGINNPSLLSRTLYFSVLKGESAANVKLRLTLQWTNGANTVTRENYTTSTSFTKSASVDREEVNLTLPSGVSGTVTWTIQVIASTAASQFVDISAPIIAVAGNPTHRIPRWFFERPLEASASWTPGAVTTGNTVTLSIPCLGARVGDIVEATDITSESGANVAGWNLSRKAVSNAVEISARNITAGTLGGWTQTMRVRVHPST